MGRHGRGGAGAGGRQEAVAGAGGQVRARGCGRGWALAGADLTILAQLAGVLSRAPAAATLAAQPSGAVYDRTTALLERSVLQWHYVCGFALSIEIDIDGQRFRLSDETAAKLQKIADTNRVPLAVALEQAILNEKFIEEQTESGAKLLIEKNGSLHELVFKAA